MGKLERNYRRIRKIIDQDWLKGLKIRSVRDAYGCRSAAGTMLWMFFGEGMNRKVGFH